MNITEKVKSNFEKMTKSEHRVGTYFILNPNDFAFETLDGIAKKTNASTTSVIRFCRKAGFSGYKAFQEAVRLSFKSDLTLPDKFERNLSSDAQDAKLLKTVKNAVDCIEKTFDALAVSKVYDAVNHIINATRVFCFGLKESFALAHYAYTRFLTVRSNVFMLSAGQSGEIESVLSLGKGDVCIFYLFHRYTKPSPQILKLLKKQGVTTILITSPPYESIEADASILLPCFVDINGIKNSSVAPVCITDHLCNAVAAASGNKTLDYMKKSETLFKEFTFQETSK